MALTSRKQNGELNILRFVFSLIVLIFHWNLTFNYGIVKNGNISVEFFFILSGLLMARNAEEEKAETPTQIAETTWKYIMRKVRAFYKYYLCVVLLQLVIRFIIIKGGSAEYVSGQLLKSLPTFSLTFMVLNYKAVSLYAGNTWFLSSMLVVMLMLYPLLLKSYDYHAKIMFPLLCLFLLGYLYYTNGSVMVWERWAGFCYFAILRAMSEITLGVCMYELSKVFVNRFSGYTENPVIKLFFTAVKILCYFVVFRFAVGTGDNSENLHILLFCGLAIALSFSEIGYTIQDSRLSRYLAKLSLPIFIFHGFMRYVARDLLGSGPISSAMFWKLVFGSLVASIILKYLTDFAFALLKKSIRLLSLPV